MQCVLKIATATEGVERDTVLINFPGAAPDPYWEGYMLFPSATLSLTIFIPLS